MTLLYFWLCLHLFQTNTHYKPSCYNTHCIVTRSAQPYIHMYSVCPFVSFTHFLFLLEEDCLQEDMALMSSLCLLSLLT
jgi:hypothetical protein